MEDQSRAQLVYSTGIGAEQWMAAAVYQISRLCTARNAFLVGMAALVARTSLQQDLFPFGLAFVAAVAARVPRRVPYAAVGAVGGMLTLASRTLTAETLLMVVGFSLALALFTDPGQVQQYGNRRFLVRAAVLVFAVYTLVHGPYVYIYAGDAIGLSPAKLLTLALGALVAAISTVIFGEALAPRESSAAAAVNASLAPLFLLAVAVAGLGGVAIGPVRVQAVVAGVLIIWFGWIGGAGVGAAAGVVLGAISGPGGLFYPPLMGRLAMAGLAAGYASRLGQFGTSLGFFLANLALTYYLLQPAAIVGTLWEAALAGLLFVFLPSRLLKAALEAWDENSDDRAGPTLAADQPGLFERPLFRRWFADVGAVRSAAKTTKDDSSLAPELAARLRKFSAVFEELSRSFQQSATATEMTYDLHEELVEVVVKRVCAGCDSFRRCWDERFYQSYQGILDLFTQNELGECADRKDVTEKIQRCVQPDELAVELNQLFEYRLLEQKWRQRVVETRAIVSTQLRGASEVMEKLAIEVDQEAHDNRHLRAVKRVRLTYEVGVSRRAKQEGAVSGDSYLVRQLPDGRWAFVLSDGMGAGPRASHESTTTTELLYRLLEAGFSPEVAVRTINSVLLFRSPEDVYATVDLVLFDPTAGGTEFLKVGAAPSFLKRGRRVERIDANTLPVGILNDIDLETRHRVLKAGDLLVMATDGIINARGDTVRDQWIAQYLRTCPHEEPQDIARGLVELAAGMTDENRADDLTALVFQVS